MGCALKWNTAEHSWDCPCHGSRFSEDGKVPNNPANGDLQFPAARAMSKSVEHINVIFMGVLLNF